MKPLIKNGADHVVLQAVEGSGGLLRCNHCQATQPIAAPCAIPVYLAILEAFGKMHRSCPDLASVSVSAPISTPADSKAQVTA